MIYLNIFKDIGDALNDFKDGVFNFFSTIGDLIGYVIHFFQELLNLIGYLWKAKDILFDFIGSLPSWLSVFAIATVTVLILYQLVGRNGGAS